MTKDHARQILDRLKEGHPMPVSLTTKALLVTGDILPRLPSSALRSNGNEPCHDRAIQMESQGIESRFSYSRYLGSPTNKGT